MDNFYKKILLSISLITFWGALIYRLYALSWLGIIGALILSGVSFFIFSKHQTTKNHLDKSKKCIIRPIYLISYLIPFIVCWAILLRSGTTESITSPWQVIPWYFFAFYLLSTLALIFHFLKKGRFSHYLFFLHSFLSFSVIWTIYHIGYGYDPFIHQASMELIKEKGAINPKPLYYLGQYAFIIITSKITLIPVVIMDKILVPATSAFLAMPATYIFIKQKINSQRQCLLALLLLLILPFSFATFTTPQNLSYVFLVTTVFYALSASKKELPIAYLLATTTFLIHPISGLPAIFFILAIHASHIKNILIKKTGIILSFLLTAISLPASFYIINKNNGAGKVGASESILNIKYPTFPNSENIFLNFSYFLSSNISWILIILSIITFIYVWKKRNEHKKLLINISLSLALLFSYFFTRSLNFGFLIDYERSDYPGRILSLAVIMLIPAILIIFSGIIGRILCQWKKIKYPLLIFIALAITASLYVSYPRKDNYFDSHGLSVSTTDIEAVSWIENDAKGDPYVVLSNQQVSVAALRTIGFRYLDNEQFFYPIPTGGDLYKDYLEMVYKEANKEPMIKAMDFGNTNIAYFILNKYWYAFDKILKEAKLSADSFIEINNNLYIFKYIREGKDK